MDRPITFEDRLAVLRELYGPEAADKVKPEDANRVSDAIVRLFADKIGGAVAKKETARKLLFTEGDQFSPIDDLQSGDKVEITDDKGRTIIGRAGEVIEENRVIHDIQKPNVKVRLVIELIRFDHESDEVERIMPGFFLDDAISQIICPMRKVGQKSPAKKSGLRFKLNPWNIFPIAPSKIVITPEQN